MEAVSTGTVVAGGGNGKMGDWWSKVIEAIKFVGFPIVVAVVAAWFGYKCIEFERQTMMPAITENTNVLNGVKDVLTKLEHRP